MSLVLKDKVAIVTGASRGMGAVIAKRLAADGAAVAITYSASPDRAAAVVAEIEKAGGRAIAVKANSAVVKEVQAAVTKTVETYGRLDILVNNAGVFTMGMIDQVSEADFDQLIDVNVKGVFAGIQAALPHLKEGGRIINIGSVISERANFPGASLYTMSKAAVAGLTRGLAHELGQRGITINNVQPGPVDTEMNPDNGSDFAEMVKKMMPIGRYGRSDEIANLVAFLASPASSLITGTGILADGGLAA